MLAAGVLGCMGQEATRLGKGLLYYILFYFILFYALINLLIYLLPL